MSIQAQGTTDGASEISAPIFNLRWAVRRTLLGILILVLGIGTLAWLTHASIDPALESASAASIATAR